ncbi:hypothetical protein PVAG01_10138 [Phlyctema vagabunda]|uniref:Uncharacterized protein n=1 Tax=Phlyctema vagabunda TaxID=108571 RepID=A0ABR4P591_9HELO
MRQFLRFTTPLRIERRRTTRLSLPIRRKYAMSAPENSANSSKHPDGGSEASSTPDENQPKPTKERLALPAAGEGGVTQLDVSGTGTSVKLDHLGPMVVNQDGTLSRISNWDQMSEFEQKTTLRVLGKRNKERLDVLKAAETAKE